MLNRLSHPGAPLNTCEERSSESGGPEAGVCLLWWVFPPLVRLSQISGPLVLLAPWRKLRHLLWPGLHVHLCAGEEGV